MVLYVLLLLTRRWHIDSLNILQRASHTNDTSQGTPWLCDFSDLAISTVRISDAELCYRSQFSSDPASKDLATLLLAKARAWEVAF